MRRSKIMTEINYLSRTDVIPADVAEAYGVHPNRIAKLGSGLVNLTFAAEASAGNIALQQLAPDTPPEAIDDFIVYTEHLHTNGWLVPQLQPTADGQNYYRDQSGRLWRGMDLIPCDDDMPNNTASPHVLNTAGALLAHWHQSMSSLDYQPKYQVPHMHDTGYHLQKLEGYLDQLPDRSQKLAEKALGVYAKLDLLPESPSQLIHGDPKLANMLFSGGRPFTLIDFDTVMRGSSWLDIGDMLRSVLKENLRTDTRPASEVVKTVASSYRNTVGATNSLYEFIHTASQATKQITLELTARYLNDIVEQNYFTWDKHKFDSRASNHLARALDQWKVFEKLERKG